MVEPSGPLRVQREHTVLEPTLGIYGVGLTCFEPDAGFWANLFPSVGIRMHQAQTLADADFLLTVTGATVLLMNVVFPDGCWYDAMTMLARFHPFAVPLLLADPVDSPFVSEAFQYGAFQVLWKPVALEELLRYIRLANEASEERLRWQRYDSSCASQPGG